MQLSPFIVSSDFIHYCVGKHWMSEAMHVIVNCIFLSRVGEVCHGHLICWAFIYFAEKFCVCHCQMFVLFVLFFVFIFVLVFFSV